MKRFTTTLALLVPISALALIPGVLGQRGSAVVAPTFKGGSGAGSPSFDPKDIYIVGGGGAGITPAFGAPGTALFTAADGASYEWDPVSGSGTVTSVGTASTPAWATLTWNTATTTPQAVLGVATGQTANEFLGTPNGTAGAVGLRAIVAADLPTIGATKGGTGSTTAPTSAQIPIGNAGGTAYAPNTVSGDGTLSNAGVLQVVKTAGVAFAASATTDTTNASNISSGTLAPARIANFTTIAAGLVPASGGGTTNFLRADGSFAAPPAGTVTAVSTAGTPAWLTSTWATATTTPAQTIGVATGQTANEFLATPDGTTGSVGLRTLVIGDIGFTLTASKGGTGSGTAPTSGQIPVGNVGGTAYVPQTMSGDGTLSSSAGLVVTKTNGSAFAASATTDATNATNISSGTLAQARIAQVTSSTAGTVSATGGGTTNFLRADNTWAAPPGTGGFTASAQTASFTAVWFGEYYVDTTAGAVTITIPTGVGNRGSHLKVKHTAGTNAIIYNTTSGQTMDGQASGSVSSSILYSAWDISSDGTNVGFW